MNAEVQSGGRQADTLAGSLWASFCKEAEALKWKDALRVGVGVVIFAIAAVIFDYQDRLENGRRDLHQWSQGCLWGAITMITVNSPVLGKTAKTCFERCLGTIVGGWLGCACFLVTRHPAWVAGISFVMAAFSSMLAVKLKLDMSCKLLSITFILVLWTPLSEAQAVAVAASRVSCIVLSVLLMGLLAMLIYPQCASEQVAPLILSEMKPLEPMRSTVLGSMHKAMESTALLNSIVWEEVINKCKEESFRISMSFRLAHKGTGRVLGAGQEASETAESKRLTSAELGAASPAMAASQGPGAAPACIEGLEKANAIPEGQIMRPPNDMTAMHEKPRLGLDAVAGGIVDAPYARHTELQSSTSEAAATTARLSGSAMFAPAREPTEADTCSTSTADLASPVSAPNIGSGANTGNGPTCDSAARQDSAAMQCSSDSQGDALSRLGTAFRAHEARCRATADTTPPAADPCTPSAADDFRAPQSGTTDLSAAPASRSTPAAQGLHVPHAEATFSRDSPPDSHGACPRMALRECTSGHSPVKSGFATMQGLPAASDTTPCSGRAPSRESQPARSEKTLSSGEAAPAKAQSRWGCLPVCCPLPQRVHEGGTDGNEETEAKKKLDAEEQAAAERVALQLGFKGYAELEREEPFFDASTAVRTQQAAAEEQLTTALSEMYVGTWAGRRWYLPTVFYQNEARNKKSWHMPEKVMTRLAMRMRRVVRVLNMLHATFRDGFQKEVLEELQHHFPLDLLVELSEAAIDTLQAFVDAFPKPHQPVTALMAPTQTRRLRKVMDVLLGLAHTSRQHKVELILLGEEVRKAVEAGNCADEAELLRRLRASWAANGPLDRMPDGEEIFLFPNTQAGWLATARWYSFHFLVQQLVEALCRLRITLNLMLPHLPGAQIAPDPQYQGDMSATPSETAEHRRMEKRSAVHVVIEG